MKTLLITLFAMLAGCASVPVEELTWMAPADCRAYGVEVADGAPATGTIVRSEFGLTHTLYRECSPGNIAISGCAKAVEGFELGTTAWYSPSHQYEIWYSDNECVPQHEACHALYEEWNHTVAFFVREAQGDFMAACPTNDRMVRFRAPYQVPAGLGAKVN